jgi:hypothetical protein
MDEIERLSINILFFSQPAECRVSDSLMRLIASVSNLSLFQTAVKATQKSDLDS